MTTVLSILDKRTADTTPEELADLVKEAQNSSTLSVSDRPALALFVVLAGVSDYKEIPALLEKYRAMIAGVGDDGMMACSSSPSRLPRSVWWWHWSCLRSESPLCARISPPC